MKKVLVTGANGQLGNCIKEAAKEFSEIDFHFVDKNALNITNATQVATFFEHHSFDFCINTAAYTQVERAESDPECFFGEC
ncbi:MAG: sugar nucleotide-binding protein [Flavobacteriaceae bacterium]